MEDDEFADVEALDAPDVAPSLQEVVVPQEAAGERLDKFLSEAFPALSRSRIKHLIEAARVYRDGVKEMNVSAKVKAGTQYRIEVPPPGYFSIDFWRSRNAVQGEAIGRGSAWFLVSPEGPVVLRQYLRGKFARPVQPILLWLRQSLELGCQSKRQDRQRQCRSYP